MKKIIIQKPDDNACAYLFSSTIEYAEWVSSSLSEPFTFKVNVTADSGTEFMVDGVYANAASGMFYAVRHYSTPHVYYVTRGGKKHTIHYTTWVIPEPYFT